MDDAELEGADHAAVRVPFGDQQVLVGVGVDAREGGEVRREVGRVLAAGSQQVVGEHPDDAGHVVRRGPPHGDIHARQSRKREKTHEPRVSGRGLCLGRITVGSVAHPWGLEPFSLWDAGGSMAGFPVNHPLPVSALTRCATGS